MVASRPAGYTADMVSIGYVLSSEEFAPRELVKQAKLAQQAKEIRPALKTSVPA